MIGIHYYKVKYLLIQLSHQQMQKLISQPNKNIQPLKGVIHHRKRK